MEKKKLEKIDALLQKLLDRELGQAEQTPPPRKKCTGNGNIIRRRKGQPDRRFAVPDCA